MNEVALHIWEAISYIMLEIFYYDFYESRHCLRSLFGSSTLLHRRSSVQNSLDSSETRSFAFSCCIFILGSTLYIFTSFSSCSRERKELRTHPSQYNSLTRNKWNSVASWLWHYFRWFFFEFGCFFDCELIWECTHSVLHLEKSQVRTFLQRNNWKWIWLR